MNLMNYTSKRLVKSLLSVLIEQSGKLYVSDINAIKSICKAVDPDKDSLLIDRIRKQQWNKITLSDIIRCLMKK